MGAYLSEPVTEKISSDEKGDYLSYGASSMQGWRVSQEDAHNCILNFNKDSSLFAVYDGHGGHEVATYCALHLPNTIKSMEAYKKGNISQALEDAFLEFDAVLTKEDIINVLKSLAKNKDNHSDSDGEEDNEVNNLYEEASMSLDDLMSKYKGENAPANPLIKKLCGGCKEKPISPYLRAKKARLEAGAAGPSGAKLNFQEKEFPLEEENFEKCVASDASGCNSKVLSEDGNGIVSSTTHEKESELSVQVTEATSEETDISDETKPEVSTVTPDSAGDIGESTVEKVNSETEDMKSEAEVKVSTVKKQDKVREEDEEQEEPSSTHNGMAETVDPVKVLNGGSKSEPKENHCSGLKDSDKSAELQENGYIVESGEEFSSVKGRGKGKGKGRGKGKSSSLTDVSEKVPVNDIKEKTDSESPDNKWNLRTITAQQLYRNMLDGGEEDSDSDEDDENFDIEESEDEDDDEDEDDEEEEESGEMGEEEVEEEEEEEEDCDYMLEDEDEDFRMDVKEEPGSDSGCTAVVAVVCGNDLYVANAGDSRCVVCRGGEAVEMSLDHKPEDDLELRRIENAGGKVTADGRVNGGLNLSRAIGDHTYKQNANLSPKEQMITALPDVRTLTINPDQDEFMILACDGIWNFMSSQEVIDFVKKRLTPETENLSKICEELFDHCLAPNTIGDGTGCDNMTAIIVKFGDLKAVAPSKATKRSATDETSDLDIKFEEKRQKLEEKQEATSELSASVEDSDSTDSEEKKQKLEDKAVGVESSV